MLYILVMIIYDEDNNGNDYLQNFTTCLFPPVSLPPVYIQNKNIHLHTNSLISTNNTYIHTLPPLNPLDCKNKIEDLKIWSQAEKNKTQSFIEEVKAPKKSAIHPKPSQGRPRRQTIQGTTNQSNLAQLQKEDEHFKEGVETTQNILKNVKLMNMKLDDISDLVRLQRQKLLNMHKEIEKSQNYMNRSKKIISSFSKELYGDKIIFTLVALITLVLISIVVASIKYKMKSDILIGDDSDSVLGEDELNQINGELFWKTEISEIGLNGIRKRNGEGHEYVKLYLINLEMQELEQEIAQISMTDEEVAEVQKLMQTEQEKNVQIASSDGAEVHVISESGVDEDNGEVEWVQDAGSGDVVKQGEVDPKEVLASVDIKDEKDSVVREGSAVHEESQDMGQVKEVNTESQNNVAVNQTTEERVLATDTLLL